MNFDSLCPLEYMSVAARENVQTGLLAWLFGSNSPLSLIRKTEILTRLSGRPLIDVKEINSKTEHDDIDLLITCTQANGSRTHIAIENKLKSIESPTQLCNYDKRLAQRHVHAKIFLTLLGEQPKGGTDWVPASYARLLEAMNADMHNDNSTENVYVRDIRAMLQRLVRAVELATSEVRFAPFLFRSHSPVAPPQDATFRSYVRTLRLRQLLQRAWYTKLAQNIVPLAPGWDVCIGTGNRSASAFLEIARVTGTGDQAVRVGLQLQGLILKAFSHPHPYPKKATKIQRASVGDALEQLRCALGLHRRHGASTTKERGFRSLKLLDHTHAQPSEIAVWATRIREYYAKLEGGPW